MLLRLGFAIPGLLVPPVVFWAMTQGDFWTLGQALVANPWGLVTLVDIYAGFIITGLIIAGLERWKPWTFGLMLLSFVLGNFVYAGWGLWRGARMLESRLFP
jgi:hypothetical protein